MGTYAIGASTGLTVAVAGSAKVASWWALLLLLVLPPPALSLIPYNNRT